MKSIPASAKIIACGLRPAAAKIQAVEASSAAIEHVERLGLAFRLHRHDHALTGLAQAAEERGLSPDQIVRSLVFRLAQDRFVVVLMPGPGPVAWPKLRRFLNVSRLTTASAGEVLAATGYRPGTVSPFGLPPGLPILADRRLLSLQVISVGAGIPNAGLILAGKDLAASLNPQFGDFSPDPQPA
jgi:Cys-tRNA(Pro)/Cys-tRNA(Cys) deacylase